MQSEFSVVCSIKTQYLYYFRWCFQEQVQGGAFPQNAAAAFFMSAHFSVVKDVAELKNFPRYCLCLLTKHL